jgi:hypothetical protein
MIGEGFNAATLLWPEPASSQFAFNRIGSFAVTPCASGGMFVTAE